jgi:hypothetical protein
MGIDQRAVDGKLALIEGGWSTEPPTGEHFRRPE